MAPHLERLEKRWVKLPAEYREKNRAKLDSYLALFNESNSKDWNAQWFPFLKSMGKPFDTLKVDVIEAMKVAECYETCQPKPRELQDRIAGKLLEGIPKGALLFIHNDQFETILSCHLQREGRRDLVLVNTARIFEGEFVTLLAERYPKKIRHQGSELFSAATLRCLERAKTGDKEFANLFGTTPGRIVARGPQEVHLLGMAMVEVLLADNKDMKAFMMPATLAEYQGEKGGRSKYFQTIDAWNHLHARGVWHVWDKTLLPDSTAPLAEWKDLFGIITATPPDQDLANAFHKLIHAANAINLVTNPEEEAFPRWFKDATAKLGIGSEHKEKE